VAPFHASKAEVHIFVVSSEAAVMARAGSAIDRSQTVRNARTTSAQSTGMTVCSGLAFHIRSIEASIGSLASILPS
jgi:hypothetical protein